MMRYGFQTPQNEDEVGLRLFLFSASLLLAAFMVSADSLVELFHALLVMQRKSNAGRHIKVILSHGNDQSLSSSCRPGVSGREVAA
ncbi:hypothetical protein EYF80_022324 [Liparis tanakae]|uniref:Uncharacterized protein n=1 Tax=Liparis tanakae TaxID=230148 RepID=A0A4Z2HNW4_9TELE|nr:hypothetical protein EYF80_022324 [Liparis tanakae]